VSPRTPAEQALANIWIGLLKLTGVSVEDNFFDLGGHSLVAARLVSQIRREFHIELPLRVIFAKPTIASLALHILEQKSRLSDEIEELLAEPIRPLPRNENLPLSFGQQRLWFLNQLQSGSAAYNISNAIQLAGSLDAGLLER